MIRTVLTIAAALAGVACAALGAGRPSAEPAKVIFSAAMCGDTSRDPAVTWIGSASDLRAVYDRIQRHQVGGDSHEPPPVDFSRRAVLWVQMGMQPSAGYGLSLQAPGARISAATLILHVKWLEPVPGRLYAQVITHPCLLVTVPRGSYHQVEVRDQHGTRRMRAEVPR